MKLLHTATGLQRNQDTDRNLNYIVIIYNKGILVYISINSVCNENMVKK